MCRVYRPLRAPHGRLFTGRGPLNPRYKSGVPSSSILLLLAQQQTSNGYGDVRLYWLMGRPDGAIEPSGRRWVCVVVVWLPVLLMEGVLLTCCSCDRSHISSVFIKSLIYGENPSEKHWFIFHAKWGWISPKVTKKKTPTRLWFHLSVVHLTFFAVTKQHRRSPPKLGTLVSYEFWFQLRPWNCINFIRYVRKRQSVWHVRDSVWRSTLRLNSHPVWDADKPRLMLM